MIEEELSGVLFVGPFALGGGALTLGLGLAELRAVRGRLLFRSLPLLTFTLLIQVDDIAHRPNPFRVRPRSPI